MLTITPPIKTNLTVEIMGGPPQTIKCRDQLNQPINIVVSIRILTAIVPTRVLVIIIFISPGRLTNITCEVSNEAGSGGTFECLLNSESVLQLLMAISFINFRKNPTTAYTRFNLIFIISIANCVIFSTL